MNKEQFVSILENIGNAKIGLLGDFCVDIYWHADMTKSELSRETPHYPLPVVRERVYPGAGGNAANNIAALKPQKLYAVGLYGDDWRGMLLRDVLQKCGIDDRWLVNTPDRFTNAYCKPIRKGISAVEYEDPRLDFAADRPIDAQTEDTVLCNLEAMAKEIDVLCVSDQFLYGIVTDRVREKIISLAKNGLPVVVDSRYNIAKYTHCILKPNEVECWRAVYANEGYLNAQKADFEKAAVQLANKNHAKVLCTLGAQGSLFTDGESIESIPAVRLDCPVDICGAGDTFLSAFSSCLAGGAKPADAAFVAAHASAVTVQKIGITGTATREEIICQFK
ncbi:MAG: sugar kinase [Ruminococcaceae bacterium]|nr:sugar kinase [Oscillospiraceae bacterium]